MADTILPKPDETKPIEQTFVPTPAPIQPSAATPSANGLAAPGAQPNPPTAPAANSVAGVAPNPTTAGNSASTNGKEAVNTLATPTPLPPEAQKPPAPDNSQPGAAPVTPKKVETYKPPASETTAQTQTVQSGKKTGSAATLDLLAPVNDTIKRMLEGDDPIARIQFNQLLTAQGPKNQAMLQNMGLKLKQANLDGQGAGDALLAMMGRDMEYDLGQLRGNIAADSAKRIYDMNVHGFDKAIEISQELERQKRTDLSTALSNGQFGAAKDLFEQIYPGIPFDEAAAKTASPQATANFNSRMKLVDQFVAQGDAANAKAVFDKLAEDMPEMFGFPNDPAGAKAALAGVDFTTEAWQNNLANTNAATTAARTAAAQGDPQALSTAVDQLFAKMAPAAVEGIATSAIKSRSLDEINQILQAAGMATVASTDEAALLDKTKFAKAVKSYDLMKGANKDVVDNLLDTFAKADPAIATDPIARQAAKAWLSLHAYGIATDPNTGAITNFTLDDKATPPWDASSPQAYLFMDWPVATFNPDGTVANRAYNGLTPYSADYKAGDLTTAKGKEDARLDKAYEQYVFSTPADKRLPMESWYYATAGGNKPVDAKLVPGSMQNQTPNPDTFKPSDTTDSRTGVRTTTELDPLTGKTVTKTVNPDPISKAFQAIGAGQTGLNAYLEDHPGGAWVITDPQSGVAAKITGVIKDSGSSTLGNVIELQDGNTGRKLYYDRESGKYFVWDESPKAGHTHVLGGKTYTSYNEALAQAG